MKQCPHGPGTDPSPRCPPRPPRRAHRMSRALLLLVFAGAFAVHGQDAEPEPAEPTLMINFREAPLEQVVQFYAELTDRTPLRNPQVDTVITLRGQTRLTVREAIEAIESVLALHDIALVPQGDRFLKVVQTSTVRQEGLPIGVPPADDTRPELSAADIPVSQVIELRHLTLAEVQPILQGLLRGHGHIEPLERTNSFLITKRELRASVSVPNRSTIVLGGLVNSSVGDARNRVPLPGSIPLLGQLFRSTSRAEQNTELLVLLTPYVMMTPAEAREETRRLHARSDARRADWAHGWSDGDLARELRGEPVPDDEIPIRTLEDAHRPRERARPDDEPETPDASDETAARPPA